MTQPQMVEVLMGARENLHVLLVDDQESMRQLVGAALKGLGIACIYSAENGLRALEQLRAHAVDLVLLDAEMPKLNGVETLTAIRADEKLRALKVIMVTGRADADFVRKTAALGISGYLIKPVSAANLAERIDIAMRKSA